MSEAATRQESVRLVPARLDLATEKTQLAIGSIVSVIAAICAFATTSRLGFIGNDFSIIQAAFAATEGGAPAFLFGLNNEAIVHAGYGPLALVWLMLGHMLFGTQAVLYHTLNIALFSICTLLVMQLGSQVFSRPSGHLAPSASLWAALLYAVHPAHTPVVASAVGSTDLLCELLCLISVFCYVRFRRLRERPYLTNALITFAAATLIKIQACTLPLVIAVAEAALFYRDKTPVYTRLLSPTSFFMVLVFISTVLLLLPWHLPVSPASMSLDRWTRLGPGVWQSLLGTTSDSVVAFLPVAIMAACAAGLILWSSRMFLRSTACLPIVWIAVWMVLSMVADNSVAQTAFNIQRTTLFATAPFCILIAALCLPAIDTLSRRLAGRFAIAGSLAMVCIFACYVTLLNQQLQIWRSLSAETRAILNAVESTSRHLPKGKGVLVGELPSELPGDWVHFAFVSPFVDVDHRVQGIPPHVMEGGYVWPQQMLSAMQATNCGALLRWDAQSGPMIEWTKPEGADAFAWSFDRKSAALAKTAQPEPQASNAEMPSFRDNGTLLHVKAGTKPLTFWLAAPPLNPLKAGVAHLQLTYKDAAGGTEIPIGRIKVIWEAGTPGGARKQAGSASVFHHDRLGYIVWLGRYPNWTLNNSILRVGLRFEPGSYDVDLSSMSLVSHTVLMPAFNLNAAGKMTNASPWAVLFTPQAMPTLRFDDTQLPDANGTRIDVWNDRAEFAPLSEAGIYDFEPSNSIKPDFHGNFIVRSDAVILSPELFSSSGVYYTRAMAIDKNDKPFGLPSEPLSFRFKRQ